MTTIAGTGEQGRDREGGGPAKTTGLNSPWDLLLIDDHLYHRHGRAPPDLAAGPHAMARSSPYAGNGREDIGDGRLDGAASPSRAAWRPTASTLYVADSEVSAIRAVPAGASADVKTLVGRGLFEFGDKDGTGDEVRLQHALGVAVWHGKLLRGRHLQQQDQGDRPADPADADVPGRRPAGREDQPARFNEPGGIHVAGDLVYVADTNNHAIRVVDLKKRSVRTLPLTGVMPPAPAPSKPGFRNLISVALPETTFISSGMSSCT